MAHRPTRIGRIFTLRVKLAAIVLLAVFGFAAYVVARSVGELRAARDSRLGPIGGGTDEIMREILSKVIGL